MNFDFFGEPLLTFVGGIVAAGLVFLSTRNKERGDAASRANDAIMRLITPLQETVDRQGAEIQQLRTRVRKLEEELHNREHYIDWLTEGIEKLIEQINDAGMMPAFDPDKWNGWGD